LAEFKFLESQILLVG